MNSFFLFFRSILSTSFQFSICARKGKKLKTNNDLFYAVTLQLSEFGAFHSMPNAGGQIKNRVQDKEDTDGEEIRCWEPNSTTANSIQTVLRHSSSAGKNCPAAFRAALFPGRRNVAFSHLVLVPGESHPGPDNTFLSSAHNKEYKFTPWKKKSHSKFFHLVCLFSFLVFTQNMILGQFKPIYAMCLVFKELFL